MDAGPRSGGQENRQAYPCAVATDPLGRPASRCRPRLCRDRADTLVSPLGSVVPIACPRERTATVNNSAIQHHDHLSEKASAQVRTIEPAQAP
ncbi:hypothetical protein GCM10023080_017080 [Streptomyces pseudoechinosporeus]